MEAELMTPARLIDMGVLDRHGCHNYQLEYDAGRRKGSGR
jgi:hypothetical protein